MRSERGFTLLEVLVATAIMGIAVAGAMSGLAASVRNASRITQYDRAAMLARAKMDELLADETTPRNRMTGAPFKLTETGGVQAGWQARVVPFETNGPEIVPGAPVVERIELEIWWLDDTLRRSFTMEGIRRAQLPAEVPR